MSRGYHGESLERVLFVGAIPRPSVEQAIKCVDLAGEKEVYVCCSGSFRMEQALSKTFDKMLIHSNDVSLLSVALGTAATGQPIPFTFKGRLEFMQDELGQNPDPMDRVAAVIVATRMCHFRGKNKYVQSQFQHYQVEFPTYLRKAREKLNDYLGSLRIADFFAGDFREHAERAVSRGALIFAWPPTHHGDYEKFYSLIHDNTEWSPPSYGMFNPDDLEPWMLELDRRGARYVVCTNRILEQHPPVARYIRGRGQPIALYSNTSRKSSWRRDGTKAQPFSYLPIEPGKLRPDTRVEVVSVDNKRMNFFKDVYQLPGLIHTDGQMRFLVFLDGMLTGGFVYSDFKAMKMPDPRLTRDSIYLLSDFSATRERKLSKLIAMLATGQESVKLYERRRFVRVPSLLTTAFSKRPISMKYRGIYELVKRDEERGMLNYFSEVRRVSNAEIYADWWKRYGKNWTPGKADS